MNLQDFIAIFQIWKQYREDEELKSAFGKLEWLLKLWESDKQGLMDFFDAFREAYEAWKEQPDEPIPVPDDPTPDPGQPEHIIVADLDLIPGLMRYQGFEGSDGAMWYGLAGIASAGPDQTLPDDDAGSMQWINAHRQEVWDWWDERMKEIEYRLRKDHKATAVAIANDARDRCGFRLGPAIMERLTEFGDRVEMGQIVPESEY